MKVLVYPQYSGQDNGDGGIRRVVEAQHKYLPTYGIETVQDEKQADLVAVHAGTWVPTDKPVVEHCHGLYWKEYEWPHWCHKMNQEVIDSMRKANAITAPSEWVAQVIRRGMWADPIVIPHGVDVEEWSSDGNHENYILWNKTRIDPVCDESPVSRLAQLDTTHQYVSTYGQPNIPNLRLTGTLPFATAKLLIQRAGVYLCTTRETFGIGTLEAMACGVPIVGFNWGGQRDIVEHGVTGWLVKPGDIDGLREGVEYCLAHRSKMSVACREVVREHYTWQEVMKQYADLYSLVHSGVVHEGPKVSVVITNYKLEKYLLDAVESVASAAKGMKPQDVEVVVVNDNSPTWSLDIVAKVADVCAENDLICTIESNEKNLYLAGALNVGIGVASGKYIVPLDADNMLAPRALATLSSALDANRDIDIAYGAMEVIESDHWNGVSGWPTEFDYRAQMAHRNQIPSTCMYRRAVWERSGGYRRRCRTAEDADFWCRVTSLGFVPKKVTDAVVLVYRDRSDSMSHVQQDWDWTAWYSWSRDPDLTPFAAPQQKTINVPSYEPIHVSVVVPVGPNHRDKVIDAVDSLVAQTYQNWECIVVNDSGEPLSWIHPFVKVVDTYVDTPINRVSHARNAGIRAASSKLFVLLDADDYLQPTALEEMLRAYTPGKYVYTDWYVSETGEISTTPEYDCKTILHKMHHSVTCLYEKEAWEKVGGFDESLRGWEDWDFIIALNAIGECCGVRVPRPLFYYRLYAGQRREELYANRDELKVEMFNKWQPYIEGRLKMACGSCGAKRAAADYVPPVTSDYRPDPSGETERIQYNGDNVGPVTYLGKVSGQRYKFGLDPEFRVRYVFARDVPGFLSMESFSIYEGSLVGANEPVLVAAGPPQ